MNRSKSGTPPFRAGIKLFHFLSKLTKIDKICQNLPKFDKIGFLGDIENSGSWGVHAKTVFFILCFVRRKLMFLGSDLISRFQRPDKKGDQDDPKNPLFDPFLSLFGNSVLFDSHIKSRFFVIFCVIKIFPFFEKMAFLKNPVFEQKSVKKWPKTRFFLSNGAMKLLIGVFRTLFEPVFGLFLALFGTSKNRKNDEKMTKKSFYDTFNFIVSI